MVRRGHASSGCLGTSTTNDSALAQTRATTWPHTRTRRRVFAEGAPCGTHWSESIDVTRKSKEQGAEPPAKLAADHTVRHEGTKHPRRPHRRGDRRRRAEAKKGAGAQSEHEEAGWWLVVRIAALWRWGAGGKAEEEREDDGGSGGGGGGEVGADELGLRLGGERRRGVRERLSAGGEAAALQAGWTRHGCGLRELVLVVRSAMVAGLIMVGAAGPRQVGAAGPRQVGAAGPRQVGAAGPRQVGAAGLVMTCRVPGRG